MLRFFTILTIILFFTACNPNSSIIISKPPAKEELQHDTIVRLPIPFQANNYSKIKTTLFTTESNFITFISKIKIDKNWNKEKRKNFISSLKINPIDFTKYNLLIYTIQESSDSTKLTIDPPKGDNAHVEIKINRETDKEGSSSTDNNITYYSLAYKVKKSVIDITFDNGLKKDIILNNNIQLKSNDIKVATNRQRYYLHKTL